MKRHYATKEKTTVGRTLLSAQVPTHRARRTAVRSV